MSVSGCRYDDYDYGEVNQLLEKGLKLYIKAVACYPDATKPPLCPLPWAPLKPAEKVSTRSRIGVGVFASYTDCSGSCVVFISFSHTVLLSLPLSSSLTLSPPLLSSGACEFVGDGGSAAG